MPELPALVQDQLLWWVQLPRLPVLSTAEGALVANDQNYIVTKHTCMSLAIINGRGESLISVKPFNYFSAVLVFIY